MPQGKAMQMDCGNQGAPRGHRRTVPAVCRSAHGLPMFMGYALLGIWIGQSGATGIVPVQLGALTYTATALAFEVAGLVVLALISRRAPSLRANTLVYRASVALALFTPIAGALMGFGPQPGGPAGTALDIACGAVCGTARALTFLMWVDAFSLLSIQSLCICFAGTSLARVALSMAASLIVQPVASCIVACLAGAASMVMCRRATYSDGPASEDGEPVDGLPRARFPWRPVLLMLVYYPAFCLVLMATGTEGSPRGPQEVGGMLAYVGVLVCALVAFRHFRLGSLCGVALPCMCAALLGVMTSVSWPTGTVLLLAGIGFHSLYLFVYLLLFTISFRYGVSTLWLIGLTTVPRVLIKGVAGIVFGASAVSTQGDALDQVVAVLAVTLIVTTMLLAFGREFGSTWGIVEDGPGSDHAGRHETMTDRCRDLSRLYGLTRREEDVLLLMAQDCGVASIGEQLVLSKGTVRNHVQHVYRKFGVHSKSELLERVGEHGTGAEVRRSGNRQS